MWRWVAAARGLVVDEVIDVHMARSMVARPKARDFGPSQARHGPLLTMPGPARPVYRAWVWAATLARPGDTGTTQF